MIAPRLSRMHCGCQANHACDQAELDSKFRQALASEPGPRIVPQPSLTDANPYNTVNVALGVSV